MAQAVPHYLEKRNKELIIFITVLHNKPQGCGASVASTAGTFTTEKKTVHIMTSVIKMCLTELVVKS
jgi:hypothetical protein